MRGNEHFLRDHGLLLHGRGLVKRVAAEDTAAKSSLRVPKFTAIMTPHSCQTLLGGLI